MSSNEIATPLEEVKKNSDELSEIAKIKKRVAKLEKNYSKKNFIWSIAVAVILSCNMADHGTFSKFLEPETLTKLAAQIKVLKSIF